MSTVIETLERAQLRRVPRFSAGDRVRVHFQVIEGTRRRTQVFEGVVIGRRNRRGLVRCYVLIRRALVTTPPGVLHTRMVMCVRELVYALADVERMITERHPGSRDTLVVFHASECGLFQGCQ